MSISGLGGALGGSRQFRPPSFGSLDSNSDKSITLDELKAGAPGGASASNESRVEALFKAMDADSSGSITDDEKTAFEQKLQDGRAGIAFLAQQMRGSADDIFSATDGDEDGAISFDEFTDSDSADNVESESLQKVFDMIDADGDGSISKTESSDFLEQVTSAMAERGPPPPPGGMGGPIGGLPSTEEDDESSSSDTTGDASIDLLTLAQNAYAKTSGSTNLLSILENLLKAA
jgi:Ca2+-binding EF-hand superfamily protein